MNINWRIIAVILLLGLGIAATYNLLTRPNPAETASAAGDMADYVLKDFELVALDDQGQESFAIKAPSLQRSDSDRSFEVTRPTFSIQGRSPWSIVADTAWVSGDNREVQLKGGVIANTQTAKGPMKLTTEQLNVYPQTKIAKAPVLATINQPGVTISGREGLEAQLETQRITFKEMRARYSGR